MQQLLPKEIPFTTLPRGPQHCRRIFSLNGYEQPLQEVLLGSQFSRHQTETSPNVIHKVQWCLAQQTRGLHCKWYKVMACFKVGILCILQMFGLCSHCSSFSSCSWDMWGHESIQACGISHQHLTRLLRHDGASVKALPICPVQPCWFQPGGNLGWS